jgi:hypothetical protein
MNAKDKAATILKAELERFAGLSELAAALQRLGDLEAVEVEVAGRVSALERREAHLRDGIASATGQAEQILRNANVRAERILADAQRSKEAAEELENRLRSELLGRINAGHAQRRAAVRSVQ